VVARVVDVEDDGTAARLSSPDEHAPATSITTTAATAADLFTGVATYRSVSTSQRSSA
jgi:hypothetical protein